MREVIFWPLLLCLAIWLFGHYSYVGVMADRKSVVQGKSVDLGGRRIIKKKTDENGVGR